MNPKLIILIGPDKAGKSTLCSALRKEYFWLKYNKGLRIESFDEMIKYDVDLLGKVQSGISPWIFDRFHYPDESIYCVLSRNSQLPEDIKKFYDIVIVSTLRHLNTLFVYCYADIQTLTKRFQSSGETDIEENWLPRLKNAYDQWVTNTTFPVLQLNSSKITREEMVQRVKFILEDDFETNILEKSEARVIS